jgi:hypothetical protein
MHHRKKLTQHIFLALGLTIFLTHLLFFCLNFKI